MQDPKTAVLRDVIRFRIDAEAEAPILWPPDTKSWFIWKDPDAGKDWRWEKKGDDRGWDAWMASLTQWTWVWVNSGVCNAQGGLACCGSWGRKELDTADWLNWTELNDNGIYFIELLWVLNELRYIKFLGQ